MRALFLRRKVCRLARKSSSQLRRGLGVELIPPYPHRASRRAGSHANLPVSIATPASPGGRSKSPAPTFVESGAHGGVGADWRSWDTVVSPDSGDTRKTVRASRRSKPLFAAANPAKREVLTPSLQTTPANPSHAEPVEARLDLLPRIGPLPRTVPFQGRSPSLDRQGSALPQHRPNPCYPPTPGLCCHLGGFSMKPTHILIALVLLTIAASILGQPAPQQPPPHRVDTVVVVESVYVFDTSIIVDTVHRVDTMLLPAQAGRQGEEGPVTKWWVPDFTAIVLILTLMLGWFTYRHQTRPILTISLKGNPCGLRIHPVMKNLSKTDALATVTIKLLIKSKDSPTVNDIDAETERLAYSGERIWFVPGQTEKGEIRGNISVREAIQGYSSKQSVSEILLSNHISMRVFVTYSRSWPRWPKRLRGRFFSLVQQWNLERGSIRREWYWVLQPDAKGEREQLLADSRGQLELPQARVAPLQRRLKALEWDWPNH